MARSALFLLASLLSSASAAVVTRIECQNAASLVNAESSIIVCPDTSVDSCLVRLGPNEPVSSINACFSDASCASAADVSAIDSLATCYLYDSLNDEETSGAELRRRRRPNSPLPAITSTSPPRTDVPEATLMVEAMNYLMARDTVSFDTNCSSYTTYRSKVCVTGSDSTATCSSATMSTATCSKGYLCKTGGCMKLDNSMDTAGIIVAICFANFIAVSAGLMCFFCCRERANDRKIAARAEAESIAKDQKRADRQPLMANESPNPFQDSQH